MLALSKESQGSQSEPPALSPRVFGAALLGSESQAGSVVAVPPRGGSRALLEDSANTQVSQKPGIPLPLEQPPGAVWSEGVLPAPGAAV